ncbi:MAG: LysM peptidoglycan-binding domain-containing protein [Bacilli bacterium]|nr:LysM peptidoglycan-binding domain-containing protein [Bacilli bacterium]
MKNTLVVIDAGHGGIDSGAIGNNLQEKDLNLEVSNYIYRRLQELNVPVVSTRTEDEYLPKEERIKRIKTITNNNPNTLLISNHMNAGGGEGAEVVFSLKNNPEFSSLILDNIGKKGQLKRKIYQRRLPENPNLDYYYILRESNSNEPVLIEYGFVDNKTDSEKLKNNLKEYGEGVVEAITTYLGVPYNQVQNQEEYIVQKGDTLYSIGRKYNISVEELKRINNLKDNMISIGQVLFLKEQNNPSNYIVQKGDTLYSIGRKFNISVEELKRVNNLNTNIISIGQELIIPIEEETEYEIYTVQKGDSLWKISVQYQIKVPDLIELNNLDNLTLQIGQKLLVPKKNDSMLY